MNEDRVQVALRDHVAEVRLVRGDKHNALDGEMFEAIAEAAGQLSTEPELRAVLIHGEGPSFCSGIDVGWLAGGQTDGFAERAGIRDGFGANLFQRVATAWIEVPVPVIAAIHGNCLGGGLQIALGADVRIASPDAKLSIREVHWGLVPDMGISATLPRLLPLDVAKELTFTGRVVSGEEADRAGLVTRIADDPLASARDLAGEIAGRSPDAVRAAKRLYESTWPATDGEGLELETELQLTLIGSPNQMAAVVAGVNGEPVDFADPAPESAGARGR
jgi:enoyl-CoA hydratase/carnithine racemase